MTEPLKCHDNIWITFLPTRPAFPPLEHVAPDDQKERLSSSTSRLSAETTATPATYSRVGIRIVQIMHHDSEHIADLLICP